MLTSGSGGRWIPQAVVVVGVYVLAVPGGSYFVQALLEPYAAALPDEQELSLGRSRR